MGAGRCTRNVSHPQRRLYSSRPQTGQRVAEEEDGHAALVADRITREARSVDSASPSSGTFTMVDGGKSEGESMTRPVGTYMYMAPEICSGDYNDKVDVWSFGILLFKLFRIGRRRASRERLAIFRQRKWNSSQTATYPKICV